MFDIRIAVGRIGFEKTMKACFPAALDKCREIRNPSFLQRLFLELGEEFLRKAWRE